MCAREQDLLGEFSNFLPEPGAAGKAAQPKGAKKKPIGQGKGAPGGTGGVGGQQQLALPPEVMKTLQQFNEQLGINPLNNPVAFPCSSPPSALLSLLPPLPRMRARDGVSHVAAVSQGPFRVWGFGFRVSCEVGAPTVLLSAHASCVLLSFEN